jgi:hypothetical protein
MFLFPNLWLATFNISPDLWSRSFPVLEAAERKNCNGCISKKKFPKPKRSNRILRRSKNFRELKPSSWKWTATVQIGSCWSTRCRFHKTFYSCNLRPQQKSCATHCHICSYTVFTAVSYAQKMFMKVTPGPDVIKHFTAVSYEFYNKLECLSLSSLSSLVYCLRVRPERTLVKCFSGARL